MRPIDRVWRIVSQESQPFDIQMAYIRRGANAPAMERALQVAHLNTLEAFPLDPEEMVLIETQLRKTTH